MEGREGEEEAGGQEGGLGREVKENALEGKRERERERRRKREKTNREGSFGERERGLVVRETSVEKRQKQLEGRERALKETEGGFGEDLMNVYYCWNWIR